MKANASSAGIARDRHSALILSLAFVPALFLVWSWTHGTTVRWPTDLLGFDSFLVVTRLQLGEGGYPTFGPLSPDYVPQFGLQGAVFSALRLWLGVSIPDFALTTARVVALVTALAVLPIAWRLGRLFGLWGVVPFWITLALSPWLAEFAHSLYWVPFTLVLPFALCAIWGHTIERRGWAGLAFLSALAVLMLLKCLCGYEYITTTTLLACTGYLLSCAGGRAQPSLRGLALVFAACVVGFVAALGLHTLQLTALTDADGWTILARAAERTGHGIYSHVFPVLAAELARKPSWDWALAILNENSWRSQILFGAFSFVRYFSLPALAIPKVDSLSIDVFATIALAPMVKLGVQMARSRSASVLLRAESAFDLSVVLSLFAALSWQILAWNHMSVHFHLNGIVFALGVIPLATVWLSLQLRALCRLGPALLPELVGLALVLVVGGVLGSAMVETRCAKMERAAFESAIERIDRTAAGSTFEGAVESLSVSEDFLGSELERGLVPAARALTVEGWVAGPDASDMLVSVLVGGRLKTILTPGLPRPDLAAAAQPLGFAATVPLLPDETGHRDTLEVIVLRGSNIADASILPLP